MESIYTHPGPDAVYRTADGALTTADDPRAAFLVIAPGGRMPMEEAIRLGLVSPTKAAPPANKRRRPPSGAS